MEKIEHPVQSLASLLKSTLLAIVLAVVVLFTAILPAEYGIDPTGVGQWLGLTSLSARPDDAKKSELACDSNASVKEHSVSIVIPAYSGLEYKFYLEKDKTLDYAWQTEGGVLYFDFHGEPKGDKTGYFKSFQEDTADQQQGALITPFAGSHGWYWKNETASPINLILKTKGDYQVLGFR
tara:strand:- start:470 stop:1009 length:540 start_codon:yes stop_codon:yes gene_type:complete